MFQKANGSFMRASRVGGQERVQVTSRYLRGFQGASRDSEGFKEVYSIRCLCRCHGGIRGVLLRFWVFQKVSLGFMQFQGSSWGS